ncbi:Organic hydroperoxide resistance transcriptional regulator [Arthrobacter sp. Bi83]|nr:Organic hydroperoxide resistance transcriptional regulator [Arthrobacter sp. Bi83]
MFVRALPGLGKLCTIELWANVVSMTNAPRLDRQVCFALYSASRAATAVYRPLLDELGLTYPQYLVMLVLWENEPRGVRELGEELGLDSGTLSPLLKRLEALGLVERRRSAEDERRVAVHLSDTGRALSSRASRIPQRLAEAAGLTPDELDQLRETLGKLTAALHDSR